MTSTLWSALILAITLAGILALRTLSKRVRIAFDIVCLAALTTLLYRRGISPFFHATASVAKASWLHKKSHEPMRRNRISYPFRGQFSSSQ
jgi:hypothetical protein